MVDPWPSPLKLEVKSSRSSQHQLSERDLAGIQLDGYAAVLIIDRLCHGPRWVLAPAKLLGVMSYTDSQLSQLATQNLTELVERLNCYWSNWILDENVWKRVFTQHQMTLQSAVDWSVQHHPPRHNQSSGNLREGRLADALRRFRDALDEFVGANGPQQEGFVHQRLLGHALEQLGYYLIENPVGVPDIVAVWQGRDSKAKPDNLRERMAKWQPPSKQLELLRDQLLHLPAEELRTLYDALIRGNDQR